MGDKDGWPAFPEAYDYERDQPGSWGGMALRDYFAAHAPPIYLMWLEKARRNDGQEQERRERMTTDEAAAAGEFHVRTYLELVADWEGEYADAKIAERDR